VPAAAVVAVPVACATVAVALATACDTVVCTAVWDTGCTVGGDIGALGSAAPAAG
jgi:predicted phosphoribosyltransferase